MNLEPVVMWLANSPSSVALRESLFVYSWVETVHVVAIMLFVGTISMVDLRLLGALLKAVPLSQMTRRILPWTVAGFIVMIVTGSLLFYANPVRTFHSIWFRIKVILLLLSAINISIFHYRERRSGGRWDRLEKSPLSVRLAGAISLILWMSVIVMGRMIAYGWFDCDKIQADWVAWFAQCHSMVM